MSEKYRGTDLLVRGLEAADVRCIFGVPGEENLDLVDALRVSPIRFITTRHEKDAAFMADVHARLAGKAGGCTATLGPGATNMITGIDDACRTISQIYRYRCIAAAWGLLRAAVEFSEIKVPADRGHPTSAFATSSVVPARSMSAGGKGKCADRASLDGRLNFMSVGGSSQRAAGPRQDVSRP